MLPTFAQIYPQKIKPLLYMFIGTDMRKGQKVVLHIQQIKKHAHHKKHMKESPSQNVQDIKDNITVDAFQIMPVENMEPHPM